MREGADVISLDTARKPEAESDPVLWFRKEIIAPVSVIWANEGKKHPLSLDEHLENRVIRKFLDALEKFKDVEDKNRRNGLALWWMLYKQDVYDAILQLTIATERIVTRLPSSYQRQVEIYEKIIGNKGRSLISTADVATQIRKEKE